MLDRLGDGPTPLALARAFQMPKTTMTHTLSGLEARGLIETRPNPKDGRSKRTWLTDKSRRFHDDAIASMAPDFAAFAERSPAKEIGDLVPRLAEVRAFLDERRDSGMGKSKSQDDRRAPPGRTHTGSRMMSRQFNNEIVAPS